MSEETRMILGKLEIITEGMQVMQADIKGLKTDVSGLKTGFTSLSARVENLETEVHTLRLVMENETNRKIDIIGEGHDFLIRHYQEAKGMVESKEKMELDILGLKADMRIVKAKVGIA